MLPLKFDKVISTASAPAALSIAVGGPFDVVAVKTNTTDGIVTLCFQRGVSPQSGQCTFTVSTTSAKSIAPFTAPLLFEGTYYVTASTNNSVQVSFEASMSITSCSTSEVYVGSACVSAPRLATGLTESLVAGVPTTMYFTVEFLSSTYPNRVSIQYDGGNLETFDIRAAFGNNNVTAALAYQQSATNLGLPKKYSFPLPSNIPGVWYFEVTLQSNTTANATLSLDSSSAACANGKGDTCVNQINTLGPVPSISGDVGAALVYTMYNGTDTQWRVGVSTVNGAAYNSALSIYIAKGYVPFQTAVNVVIADWTAGCTLPAAQCTQVATIELPKANVPYYIAIAYHNATLASTPYLIWQSTAAVPCPSCNHGTCTPTDATYGQCKCNYGWTGVNCNTAVSTNFKIQIIVVIIIGALLLVTAIIGLIAWFISKRQSSKTSGYERV